MKSKRRALSRWVSDVLALAAFFVVAAVPSAWAWARDGHRIIAEIAEQYLAVEAAQQVRDLLALENITTLADISSWADNIRLQRRDTGPWHYVNIPVHPQPGTPAAYDHDRDCPQDDCVVAKIAAFEGVLRDKDAVPQQRLEALKFFVHLVGDIHQPLHCADDHDRGGNDIFVQWNGGRSNLHALWDSGILAPALFADERNYALKLVKSIGQETLVQWQQDGPAEWADQSYRIAVDVIYKNLPSEAGVLPQNYAGQMLPAVDTQLKRAGVRLAKALNAALGTH